MRRGSALLIVLGLLSFTIVSAVAFSAYMRSSRVPSSNLLRVSSSRNLARAALARAMWKIDTALDDDPFPLTPEEVAQRQQASAQQSGASVRQQNATSPNQWRSRVLLGGPDTVDPQDTVATTTLEGLAYLPAPLINTTRYYSRVSPTGVWQYMDLDVGRYAFTAVDVSDYFDVNRTMAAPEGGGRTSADNARITLAYLFEKEGHTGGWRAKPDDWDTFMDTFAAGGSAVPLVSWADLNLAIWDKKPNGVISPWCRFVENGTEFLQDSADDRQTIGNMVFVTDSIAAPQQGEYFDLARTEDQPFPTMGAWPKDSYANRGADDFIQAVSTKALAGEKLWPNLLAPSELVQLGDYLDLDDIPSTLALPTVERTPMITGVYLHPGQMAVKIEKNDQGYDTPEFVQAGGTYKYHVTTYSVSLDVDELAALVGLVYPFRHGRGANPKSYQVQAFATFAFVSDGVENLRPGTSGWATVPDWTGASDGQPQKGVFANAANRPSGYWVRSRPVSVTPPDDVEDEEDAVMEDQELSFGSFNLGFTSKLPASANGIAGLHEDECTVRICQKMVKTVSPSGVASWTTTGDPAVREFGALPAAANLGEALLEADLTDGAEFRPSIQLWVRVIDPSATKSCQTVDLMPACVEDDARPSELVAEADGSRRRPALRFGGPDASKVKVETAGLSGGGDVTPVPQAYVTGDPRFNYAPENCWAVESLSGMLRDEWLKRARAMYEGRDGDLFMSTSDAGYLQSKYELMFLSRIAAFDATVDFGCLAGNAYDGLARQSSATLAADKAMWRTYSQYAVNGQSDKTALDKFPIINGRSGTRVNPYTPSRTVMMGALANTPRDWWAASTNDTEAAKATMLGDIEKALEYTFSEHSNDKGCSGVKWTTLETLADTLRTRLRASATVDGWKDIYDGLDWDGALLDTIADGSGINLFSVDRKFLFGFWRECLAPRQQLFLVLLRAEPLLMGCGTQTRIPPVLGIRAVALVWRNPYAKADADASAPHDMRVLFYRVLD